MSETKNLRLARPYRSVGQYLAAEGWTIGAKGMILVEQPRLPSGTIVRFEVVLESGEKPIRAEGRVIGFVRETGDRPSGVRVRFTRLGTACKAFLDQVLADRGNMSGAVVEPTAISQLGDEPMPPSLPPIVLSAPIAESSVPESPQAESTEAESAPRQSTVAPRRTGPVEAPANREELLERLRERARRARSGD